MSRLYCTEDCFIKSFRIRVCQAWGNDIVDYVNNSLGMTYGARFDGMQVVISADIDGLEVEDIVKLMQEELNMHSAYLSVEEVS